jgi:hypothetical protein
VAAKAGKSPKDDKAAQEKKDLDASLQLQQLYLKRLEDAYKSTNDKLEKAFEKTGDEAAYSLGAKEAVEVFRQSSAVISGRNGADRYPPGPDGRQGKRD